MVFRRPASRMGRQAAGLWSGSTKYPLEFLPLRRIVGESLAPGITGRDILQPTIRRDGLFRHSP